MTKKKYYLLKTIKTFWREGEWIRTGEMIECDGSCKKQLVDEMGVCIVEKEMGK